MPALSTVQPVPQLLLIEDDARIRTALVRTLAARGYAVDSANSGMAGLRQAVEGACDLVVLDLGLPDVDGHELLRMLRGVSAVPVIVATARDEEAEIVATLDAGADDYVVKPFSAAQLDARIRAVLRRTAGEQGAGPVVVGGLRIDPRTREASRDGQSLELSPREFELLLYLAERAGQVVSKRELLVEVWRQPYSQADKTVDVHLSWLRRKLRESGQEPVYLHTVRGVGVKLVDPTG